MPYTVIDVCYSQRMQLHWPSWCQSAFMPGFHPGLASAWDLDCGQGLAWTLQNLIPELELLSHLLGILDCEFLNDVLLFFDLHFELLNQSVVLATSNEKIIAVTKTGMTTYFLEMWVSLSAIVFLSP